MSDQRSTSMGELKNMHTISGQRVSLDYDPKDHDADCPGCAANKVREEIKQRLEPKPHPWTHYPESASYLLGDIKDDMCYVCGRAKRYHIDALIDESIAVVETPPPHSTVSNVVVALSHSAEARDLIAAAEYRGQLIDTLPEWIEAVHQNAKSHGFHEDRINMHKSILLIIGELSELHEHLRNGHPEDSWWLVRDERGEWKPDGPLIELIDAMIRIWDLFGLIGINPAYINTLTRMKHNYNVGRPYKHGKKF